MDDVEQLFEAFRVRPISSTTSKLNILMELERLHDPRIVPFLLQVLMDSQQAAEVRTYLLRQLRNGSLASEHRTSAADAIVQVLADRSGPDVRLHATLALAEFTDVGSVPSMLGGLALDPREPLDVRYSAFTSLERAGPTPECVALLRQLLADETFGRSARSLLSSWQLE